MCVAVVEGRAWVRWPKLPHRPWALGMLVLCNHKLIANYVALTAGLCTMMLSREPEHVKHSKSRAAPMHLKLLYLHVANVFPSFCLPAQVNSGACIRQVQAPQLSRPGSGQARWAVHDMQLLRRHDPERRVHERCYGELSLTVQQQHWICSAS